MSYEIVLESACDLDADLRKKYGVYPEIIRGFVMFQVKKNSLLIMIIRIFLEKNILKS